MSIKRFNEFQSINEAIGSKKISDIYTSVKKLRGEAKAKYNQAYDAYNNPPEDAEYDGTLYDKKNKAESEYEKYDKAYNNLQGYLRELNWQGMNIEKLDDDIVEVIDEKGGDDSTKLRRKPYSQENYYVLALSEFKLPVDKRDSAIGDVLDDNEPTSMYLPIGYFKGTHKFGGTYPTYRNYYENRKGIIEDGTLFFVIKADSDEEKGSLQDDRRERQKDIVQPRNSYGQRADFYDKNVKSDNIKRYSDKLASKKNYDHIHSIMIDIIKAKNKAEEKYLDSLKDTGDRYSRAGESGLKEALVGFINSHGSDITVSDSGMYNKTSTSVLNDLFNSYIGSYKTFKGDGYDKDKTSSLKQLAAFDILLPDLLKFVKKYKKKDK